MSGSLLKSAVNALHRLPEGEQEQVDERLLDDVWAMRVDVHPTRQDSPGVYL